jgi:hypothetical protein
VTCVRDGLELAPFRDLAALAEGAPEPSSWRARCEAAGVADLALGRSTRRAGARRLDFFGLGR